MQWSLLPSIRTRSASGCANVFWRTCFPSGTCASIVERSNKSITSTNPKNVECHLLSHSCPMNALKTSCSWRSVSPYPAPTTRRFLPLIEKYWHQGLLYTLLMRRGPDLFHDNHRDYEGLAQDWFGMLPVLPGSDVRIGAISPAYSGE